MAMALSPAAFSVARWPRSRSRWAATNRIRVVLPSAPDPCPSFRMLKSRLASSIGIGISSWASNFREERMSSALSAGTSAWRTNTRGPETPRTTLL